jgi:hypothetical protein
MIKKLTTMQRAGALTITGGLRTSPTDALNTYASTLPICLKVGKALYRAAVHFTSLPDSHPLYRQYRLAGARRTKKHRSAMHHMTQFYGIKATATETLPVVRQNPAERSRRPATLEIAVDKEASVESDRNVRETIKVYMDRSTYDGKVGAAAVLIRQGKVD